MEGSGSPGCTWLFRYTRIELETFLMSLIAVYVSGAVTFLVGLYHVKLYKIRNWEENFKALDLFTQRVIYTINITFQGK